MLNGIDISKWQNGIDLEKISVDFVIMKATEGVGYTDRLCDSFYQKAKSLGKKLGVYHFARPDLGNQAIDEADYFLQETKGYQKEAIFILDWESGNLGNVSWAKAWLDRVYESTGVKPFIYMSASVMRSYDWFSVASNQYPLWIANYGSNNGIANENVFRSYPFQYWSTYTLWQYTSVGQLDGYANFLDLNYFNGDFSLWDQYVKGDNSMQDLSSLNSKSSIELADLVIRGVFGNGQDRKEALGSRYDEVQRLVNEKLGLIEEPTIYYTIQEGDTLTFLANQFHTTVEKLVMDNAIFDPNIISVGEQLIIHKKVG